MGAIHQHVVSTTSSRRVYYTRGDQHNGEIDFLIGCDVKFDSGLVQESNCERQHNAFPRKSPRLVRQEHS